MRGRRQKHCLLPVRFLQPQVGREKISIRDLTLLHQFLHRLPHGRFVRRRIGRRRLDVNNEPIGLGQPANARAPLALRLGKWQTHLLLARLQLGKDTLAVGT